jgi:RAB protein geranylgeranyltransferase component A
MVRKNSLRSFCLSSLIHDRKFGLDDNTVDFIGHALALHRDDRYLSEPALDTVKRMKVNLLDKLVNLSELWILN